MNKQNMEVLTNVIGAVESGGQVYGQRRYEAYADPYTNTSKEYTITLGWAQNYGSEAKKLIQMIYDADPAGFKKIDSSGSIQSMLSKDWVAIRWKPTAAQKKILINLITSDVGKKCQDDLFAELMEKFISECEKSYSKDVQVIMMYCEIRHLGGAGPVKRIFDRISGTITLDKIMASLVKDQKDTSSANQVGDTKFWSRHLKCKEFIERYAVSETEEEGMKEMFEIQNVLDVAFTEVGYMEKRSNKDLDSKTANAGSNNYTKYGRDLMATLPEYGDTYGLSYQWCDQFVDWCFLKAYGKAGAKKLLIDWSAYTPTSAGYFKKAGRYNRTPSVGAVIFFHNSERICHTGIVYAYDDKKVYTVEGNTSNGTSVISNGGMVCKKAYDRSNSRIDGYGHPDYGTPEPAPVGGAVSAGQHFLNMYYAAVVRKANDELLDEDNDFGILTYNACLAVWKDVANRKYGAKLTITNHNFGALCKEAAKKMAVSKGCEGTLVWIYQTMLAAYGFYTSSMDGAFGSNMDKAVKEFQKAVGLEADGSMGADSVYALFNYKGL